MNRQEPTSGHVSDQTALGSPQPPAALARTGAANEGGSPSDAQGAAPSNTAPDNCKYVEFKALRWSVDSLYLSFKGNLYPEKQKLLERLKKLAQSDDESEVAQAQLGIGEHIFEVKDKGSKIFSYVLVDGSFDIRLSKPSKTKPMAYAQIRAEYLAHVGPEKAQAHLMSLLHELGALEGEPTVSRIDLCVDFTTNIEMDSWDRGAWVTRAEVIDAHSVHQRFTGWSIGLGAAMSARMYDKLAEIFVSFKDWVLQLWIDAGWDMSSPVYRMEFQFRRDVLGQFKLDTLKDILKVKSGLWSYATTEWLKLTMPNESDKTRSRWPIHPLWGYISSVDWETAGGPPLKRHKPERTPGSHKLVQMMASLLTSHAAKSDLDDLFDSYEDMGAALQEFIAKKAELAGMPFEAYVKRQIALKHRQFNTRLNKPDIEDKMTEQSYRARTGR